jgi:hypothetical protein
MRAIIALLVVLGFSSPAAADVVLLPYGPVFPYGPAYFRPERYMQVDQQYFELSLGGLQRLCAAQPGMCRSDAQRAELSSLRNRQVAGVALIVGGVAAAVGGTIWTLSSTHYDSQGFLTSANDVPLFVGLGLGITLPLVGGIVAPHGGDIVDFVNGINGQQPEHPVELHLGAVAPRARGVALTMHF